MRGAGGARPPHVVWLRDPAPFVECAHHRRRRRRRRRRVARVRPGGAGGRARASEMLSVKQDASRRGIRQMGSVRPVGPCCAPRPVVARLRTRGRAPSNRGRRRPRGVGGARGGTASLSGRGACAAWPGLTESHPRRARTRGSSELWAAERPSACSGRRFAHATRSRARVHSPRRRALLCASSARAAPTPARERRRPPPPSRRRLAWLAAAAPPARPRASSSTSCPSPAAARRRRGRRVAGRTAARHQLRALRDGLGAARALGRELAVPPLRCYCDRAPSGADPLLRLGCRLPSAESEAYLPFACAPDHLLRADAWANDASTGGARLRPTESVRRWRLPERRIAVHRARAARRRRPTGRRRAPARRASSSRARIKVA